jgi:hypothetical protein
MENETVCGPFSARSAGTQSLLEDFAGEFFDGHLFLLGDLTQG